jgi:hypothetical protein
MKNSLLLLLSLFTVLTMRAQFYAGDSLKTISACDCNKKLNKLDVKFRLPGNIRDYDVFRILLVDEANIPSSFGSYGSKYIWGVTYDAKSFSPKQRMNFNLLDPSVYPVRTTPEEKGLFRGSQGYDYESFCYRTGGEEIKMKFIIVGFKVIDHSIEYTVNQSTKTITGKLNKHYDSGTVIGNSESIVVKQLKM